MSFPKEAAVGFFVMLGLVAVSAYLTVKLGRIEVCPFREDIVLTASFDPASAACAPERRLRSPVSASGGSKSIRFDDKQPRALSMQLSGTMCISRTGCHRVGPNAAGSLAMRLSAWSPAALGNR